GHGQWVPVERADLVVLAADDHVHDLLGPADRAAGQPAAEGLREAHDVRADAERLRRAARVDGETGLDLVEREQRAVLFRDPPHPLQVPRQPRDDDAAVHHHGFHDHPGDLAVVLGEDPLERLEVVERYYAGQLDDLSWDPGGGWRAERMVVRPELLAL